MLKTNITFDQFNESLLNISNTFHTDPKLLNGSLQYFFYQLYITLHKKPQVLWRPVFTPDHDLCMIYVCCIGSLCGEVKGGVCRDQAELSAE